MKKFVKVILFGIMSMLVFTNCTKVPAGNVGVKVYLLGGAKGVESEVLGVGRYWVGVNEDLFLFPTFQQNYVFCRDGDEDENDDSNGDESFTFQTREGMECSMDIGLAMHADPSKISTVFQTYRKGMQEIRSVVMRNAIRDAANKIASQLPVESVYGEGKAAFMDSIQVTLKRQFDNTGLVIDKVSLIGSIRLPDAVVGALNAKIQATQKAQQRENELREAEAEAKKKEAYAKGTADSIAIIADANRKLAASISPTLVQYMIATKWDGALPQYSGSGTPIIDLRGIK